MADKNEEHLRGEIPCLEGRPLLTDELDAFDMEHYKPFGRSSKKSALQHLCKYLKVAIKTILVCLALWGFFSVFNGGKIQITYSSPKLRSCSCGGTTVAEAKARGCIFTPLAIAWLPPHCIDMELADAFDKAGPGVNGTWEYYADPNATIPLSREEISMLADTEGAVFYTTQEWHVRHCMYTWMKHYRSKTTGVTIENRSNGLKHIRHCEMVTTIDVPMQRVFTRSGIELNADLV